MESPQSNCNSTELELIFVITNGFDKFNLEFDDTIIHVKLYDNTPLEAVNRRILARLGSESYDELIYTRRNVLGSLDLSKDSRGLGLSDRELIFVEGKNAAFKNAKRTNTSQSIGDEAPIELTCLTRVGSDDGSLRKIRVIVNPNHFCHDMLEEVSSYLGRPGLKFKCGRVVLKGGNNVVLFIMLQAFC